MLSTAKEPFVSNTPRLSEPIKIDYPKCLRHSSKMDTENLAYIRQKIRESRLFKSKIDPHLECGLMKKMYKGVYEPNAEENPLDQEIHINDFIVKNENYK